VRHHLPREQFMTTPLVLRVLAGKLAMLMLTYQTQLTSVLCPRW
jgi:hypothetical protein